MNALRKMMVVLGWLGVAASAGAQERYTAPQPTTNLSGEVPTAQRSTTLSTSANTTWKQNTKPLLGTVSPYQQANYEQAPAMAAAANPDQGIMHGGVPGAVYSPWVGSSLAGACCGPLGANGPVTYEVYVRTGPSLITGGGELKDLLKTLGWNATGGSRTLFFNPSGDSAWAVDLGIGFTRNDGNLLSRTTNVDRSQLKGGVPSQTDLFSVGVTGMNRTSLNFGFGRDYFLNGPGVVGLETYGNTRFGWDIGGKWGTSSIDLVPENEPNGYRRRHSVYHGLSLASHYNWEIPMKSWTFIVGARVEWSYYWMNLIPPQDSDIRDVNLLMMFGVRF